MTREQRAAATRLTQESHDWLTEIRQLAAIAVLMNRQARLAMRLMTLMLALFGVMVWVPHLIAHPKAHFNWSECVLTFLVTGAAWVVADLKSF